MTQTIPESLTRTALPKRIYGRIGFPETSEGCWTWNGQRKSDGYGRIWFQGRMTLAHRAVYTLLVGEILEGLTLDHLCRVPWCVNPAHLEPCSVGENSLRGNTLAGVNARKTACDNGHPYTPETVYVWRGNRHCRICNRNRKREERARA